MNPFEQKIIDAFLNRSIASKGEFEALTSSGGIGKGNRRPLRLRSVSIFPEFDAAPPDEKESYLEAAEALERGGLVSLKWEKHSKGERLKTLCCSDLDKIFEAAGRKDPKIEAAEIRLMIKNQIPALEQMFPNLRQDDSGRKRQNTEVLSFLHYLADNFGSTEVKRGLDFKAAGDIIRLMEVFLAPEKWEGISIRALSVLLYHDSKRLETLLDLKSPLLSQAQKAGASVFALPERSFPETMISGRLIFEYHDEQTPPLINTAGLMLGFPLSSALAIRNIKTIMHNENPKVLTVENKETFHVFGTSHNHGFDCCLYSGGYPNRAASVLIKALAVADFSFYHAGDLDPDGILILQNIHDIAGKPVVPLRMDAATFDRYLPWGRRLFKSILRHIEHIREETRAIPHLADLICRIQETGRGVEQEVIDYRQ